MPHKRRPAHDPACPIHVTMRAVRGLCSLRSFHIAGAIGRGFRRAKDRGRGVAQFAIQETHLHLIFEAPDRIAANVAPPTEPFAHHRRNHPRTHPGPAAPPPCAPSLRRTTATPPPCPCTQPSVTVLRVRLLRRPTPATLLYLASLLVVVAMYLANTALVADPKHPRGDGKYRPLLARGDGHATYLMLRSLVLDGDLDLSNDFSRFSSIWPAVLAPTGRPSTVHPIGSVLVWAPLFATAHVTATAANAAGANIPEHGYTLWHQRIVFAVAPLLTFLACWMGGRLAHRLLGGRHAPAFAAVAILFGTSATAYATYIPAMSHPPDAAAHALFVTTWALGFATLTARRFALLGALIGLAALIRVSGFGLGVALLVEAAILLARGAPGGRLRLALRLVALGALAAATALLTFTPQMLAWKYIFGEYLVTPMGSGFMRLAHPQLVELLFSARNGWFSTTPLAYAGVVGLFFVPRAARPVAAGLLAVVAVQLYVNASVYDWWSGSSYGARRMVSATAILVVGLAALLSWVSRRAARVPAVARLAVAVLVLGWFVGWNLQRVSLLRGGRPAPSDPTPACCGGLTPPFSTLGRPIHARFGNPFSLPASLVWSLRHGRPLRDWERSGIYIFEPAWDEITSGSYRRARTGWNVASPNLEPFSSGVSRALPLPPGSPPAAAPTYRWSIAERARILVPLLHPEPHCLVLRLQPRVAGQTVRVSGNGGAEVTHTLSALRWTDVRVDLDAFVGDNHVDLRAELAAPASPPALPAPDGTPRVGVALSRAELAMGRCR